MFTQGLPTVVGVISKHVDLHLGQSLGVPRRTHTYCAVITVIGGLAHLLLDVCLPAIISN